MQGEGVWRQGDRKTAPVTNVGRDPHQIHKQLSSSLPFSLFSPQPPCSFLQSMMMQGKNFYSKKVFIFEKYWEAQEATIKRGFGGDEVE